MAKIKNPFEGSRGKLGALVFYQVGSECYVRTKPQRFTDRRSTRQLAQRQRLQVVNNFLSMYRDTLSRTFLADESGKAGFQAAKSYNMRHALTGDYPDIRIDHSKLLLSKGQLPVPMYATAAAHPEGVLITWENGPEAPGGRALDTLVVMACFPDSGSGIRRFTDVCRANGSYVLKLSKNITNGDLPLIWIAFRDPSESQVSNSLFVVNN